MDAAILDERIRKIISACAGNSYVFICASRSDDQQQYFRYLIGCDPRWFYQYEARHAYLIDPVLAHSEDHSDPILGSAIVRRALSQGQRDVLALAQQFGFASAIVVPCHGPSPRRSGVLCVGAALPPERGEPALWRHRQALRLLSFDLLDWVVENARSQFAQRYAIDPNDVACLQFASSGETSIEIAQRLGLTPRAVDERFRRLCARMEAASRKAAIAQAQLHGLIR